MDLIIKNANTVDGSKIEIAIQDGKIHSIAPKLDLTAKEILVLSDDEYISAGWIDIHVHCYSKMDLYTDSPDAVGIESGVTTIIDAGSCGADNISTFYDLAQKAKTNVYAFLNISKTGIITQDELSDLEDINMQKIQEAFKKYPDFIKGLKARMSQSVVLKQGIKPLEIAKEIQKELDYPKLMIHIGSAPPKLDDIMVLLDENDIITHTFNGKENNILNDKNEIRQTVLDARSRNVHFDLGHGSASFNFEVSRKALAHNFKVDTISTDIYNRNRLSGPVYDLATTMDKMMTIGYTLNEVVEMVTSKPAKLMAFENKGLIQEGYDADFTIFKYHTNKSKTLVDSNGFEEASKGIIEARYAVVAGEVMKVSSK